MNKLIFWVSNNKEWVFSGLGVFLISSLLTFGWKSIFDPQEKSLKQLNTADNNSNIVQIENSNGDINISQPQIYQARETLADESFYSNDIEFKKDDFQRVKVIETEDGWEDFTNRSALKSSGCENFDSNVNVDNLSRYEYTIYIPCKFKQQADYVAIGYGQENPVFDIVFVNNYPIDLTVTKLGVEVIDTRYVSWDGGDAQPQKVPITEKISISFPHDLCRVQPGPRERGECQLPRSIDTELEDPYFLTPNSVFRYNFEIKAAGSLHDSRTATLARFYLQTNKGKAFSGLVFIRN